MENGKKARASIKKDKFAGNSIFVKLYIHIYVMESIDFQE